MGTTKTAIQNTSLAGLRYAWVLVVEGLDYLVTNVASSSGHLTALRTAWAGTDWASSTPIGGLRVQGDFAQSITPWEGKVEVPSMTFVVTPDADDTFGTDLHKTGAGNQGFLSPFADGGSFQTEVDLAAGGLLPGSTVAGTRNTGALSAGDIYIGNERLTYSTTTAASGDDPAGFGSAGTPLTRGRYSPFKVDGGGNFGRYHPHTASDGLDTELPPVISDAPRNWIGKYVGLYMHRIQGQETVVGTWLTLNGIQYASITDAAQTNLDITTSLSLQAIIRPANTSGTQTLCGKWGGNPDRSYLLQFTSTNIEFRLSGNGNTSVNHQWSWSPSALTTYGITVTWSANDARCYIDGSPTGGSLALFAGPINSGGGSFDVGQDSVGIARLDGDITEVRVWDKVLTAGEVSSNWNQRLAGTETNLVSYYVTGSDVTDSSSSGNDLTAVSGPTYTTDGYPITVLPNLEFWDTKANAELCFAGTIQSISDSSDGSTVVECDDIRSKIRDTVLLQNQWVGIPREGRYIIDNERVHIGEAGNEATLRFVSGTPGTDEAQGERWYTAEQLADEINNWLATQTTTTYNYQLLKIALDRDVNAYSLRADNGGASFSAEIGMFATPGILPFLGLTDAASEATGANPIKSGYEESVNVITIYGFGPPLLRDTRFRYESVSECSGIQGSWINNNSLDSWPTIQNNEKPPAGEDWGFISVNEELYKVKRAEADGVVTFTEISKIDKMFNVLNETYLNSELDPGETEFRQVLILEGTLKDVLVRLLASTGDSGYNNATYDLYPPQVGAAIPWDLLGTNFVNSVDYAAGTSAENRLLLVLSEPTALEDAIMPELLLRNAYLGWKDEGLQLLKPQTPSSLTADADWIFDDANKATSAKGDLQRSITTITTDLMRNSIKVKYNRSLDGEYHETMNLTFTSEVAASGLTRPVTLNARNSYGLWSNAGEGIRDLVYQMGASVLPMFAKPVALLRRTMNHHFFWATPGDLCVVTDAHARDPLTGQRGITSKPGMILGTTFNWGNGKNDIYGEVDILLFPVDEMTRYSPAAKLASYLSPVITCEQNEFSLSGNDAGDWFNDGDEIFIYEADPSASGSADSWTRTILASSGNDIALTSGLSSPAYDAAKTYYIVSATYDSATATQQADTYMADDADWRIGADSRDPYRYSELRDIETTAGLDLTRLPDRHSDGQYGDGTPVNPLTVRAMVRMINNMTSYRTAPSAPVVWTQNDGASYTNELKVTTTGYQGRAIYPIYCGPGKMPGGYTRKISIGLVLKVTNTATGVVRCTMSAEPPSGTDANLDDWKFRRPYNQLEISDTGTGAVRTLNAQDIDVAYNNSTGVGFLSIELKSSSGQIELLGFHTFLYGPLEAI